MKRILGVTGGIAAGKSTVSARLLKLGAEVISADSVAHDLQKNGSPLNCMLAEEFGAQILDKDGGIMRSVLAKLVFNCKEQLARLNAIMHPAIVNEMLTLSNASDKSIIVFDAPLLVEANMHKLVDEVWLVCAPYDVRISRIIERDNATCEDAKRRIAARMSDAELYKYADVILFNTGTEDTLEDAVSALFYERLCDNE